MAWRRFFPDEQDVSALGGARFRRHDAVTQSFRGPRDVAQRLVTAERDPEQRSRRQGVERQTCPHEGHRAGFARDVEPDRGNVWRKHVGSLAAGRPFFKA